MSGKASKASIMYECFPSNQALIKAYKKVEIEMRRLIGKYENVLSDAEKCKAYALLWGCSVVENYQRSFFYQVLIPTYNVFDNTHGRYLTILNAIKANNPEWVTAFENDHEYKLSRCKVSVYSLEEALTT